MPHKPHRPGRFVLVSDEARVTGLLKAGLREFFPGVPLRPFTNRIAIHALRSLGKPGTDWLLTCERIPESGGSLIQGTADTCFNGWQLAEQWAGGKRGSKSRRAVVITERPWHPKSPPIHGRIMAIPRTHLEPDLCELREIIHAGEAGVDYLPPTIVTLEIRKEGRSFALRVKGDPTGPLAERLMARFEDHPPHPKQSFRDFLRSARLRTFKGFLKPESFARGINLLSDRLNSAPQPLLRWVASAADEATEFLTGSRCSADTPSTGPFPVHVHIHWKCRESFQPLDLVRTAASGIDFLNSRFPIVWHLARRDGNHAGVESPHNPVSYAPDCFEVLHSCVEALRLNDQDYPGLGELAAHSREVLVAAGFPSVEPADIRTPEGLKDIFTRDRLRAGVTVHITTHGLRGKPVHTSGLVIGPVPTLSGDTAQVVTALNLSDGRPPRVNFGFFNACELANQLSQAEAERELTGSFAEDVIAHGVCAEVICNRWPVTVVQALPLARLFYRTRPITVHGRAAALLRARLEVFDLFRGREVDGLTDRSWLAPLHVSRSG